MNAFRMGEDLPIAERRVFVAAPAPRGYVSDVHSVDVPEAAEAGRAAPRVDVAARDFARRVRQRFGSRVHSIVLYGSQARGEARADSDVDIFVLVANLIEAERRALFELAGELSIEHLLTLQAFAPLPEEHAWLAHNECRILDDIEREGIRL